ncbi:MAG: CCC motif membrane protein [Bacteroidota bacterium]|jgi:hypothetical protein|nr:CCC motif membrane protein [Bacteroidota bacterium]
MEIIDPNPNFSQNEPPRYLQTVPYSTAVLVLGILSIVICCGFVGLILGIIALVLANSGEQAYLANPQAYAETSYKNLRAGKICAIIGICLGALSFVVILIKGLAIGTLFNFFPWHEFRNW